MVSADAIAMLNFLFEHRSEGSGPDLPRPLRLYLVACARKHWRVLPVPARVLITIAERMAEGWVPDLDLYETLYHLAELLTHCEGQKETLDRITEELRTLGFPPEAVQDPPPGRIPTQEWPVMLQLAFLPLWRRGPFANWLPPYLHNADTLRDTFRYPDASSLFLSNWRTASVVGLARSMYDNNDFKAMPALFDAMLEAGCDDASILLHCRQSEPHVRGCWVIDLILRQPEARTDDDDY
jgi:hypothetical protein